MPINVLNVQDTVVTMNVTPFWEFGLLCYSFLRVKRQVTFASFFIFYKISCVVSYFFIKINFDFIITFVFISMIEFSLVFSNFCFSLTML